MAKGEKKSNKKKKDASVEEIINKDNQKDDEIEEITEIPKSLVDASATPVNPTATLDKDDDVENDDDEVDDEIEDRCSSDSSDDAMSSTHTLMSVLTMMQDNNERILKHVAESSERMIEKALSTAIGKLQVSPPEPQHHVRAATTARSSNANPVIIKEFSGSSGEDVEEFAYHIRHAFRATSMDDDTSRARLAMALTGSASKWYRSYPNIESMHTENILEELIKAFAGSRASLSRSHDAFTMRQLEGQSVNSLAFDLAAAIQKFDPRMGDSTRAHLLLRALSDPISDVIIRDLPKNPTWSDVLNAAQNEEDTAKFKLKKQSSVQSSPVRKTVNEVSTSVNESVTQASSSVNAALVAAVTALNDNLSEMRQQRREFRPAG